MKYRPFAAPAALFAVAALGLPVMGQSRDAQVDRITSAVSDTIAGNGTAGGAVQGEGGAAATPRQLLRATQMTIDLRDTPARLALEIWSQQTQIPLVVNWAALEAAGFDLDQTLSLRLNRVPAATALNLLVNQMNAEAFEDDRLLVEVNEYYVRVMTRDEALRRSTTKLYFIGDLLMDVPDFAGPEFDLNNALSNTSSGGSNGGGGGQGLFDDEERDDTPQLSAAEKADQIAQLIRDTIEPEIWRGNGGRYASIRYYRGMLVVRAPQFVHDQIGVPAVEPRTRSSRQSSSDRRDREDRSGQPSSISGTSDPVRTVR